MKHKNYIIFLRQLLFLLIIGSSMYLIAMWVENEPSETNNSKIYLPKNVEYNFSCDNVKTSQNITHRKNNLGFRGPDYKKEESDSIYRIVFVGGSNVECFFISDQHLWTNLLSDSLNKYECKVWINNAGMDGLSTVGIEEMIKKYIIPVKPNIIFIMINTNEIMKDYADNNKSFFGLIFMQRNNVGTNLNDIDKRGKLSLEKTYIYSVLNTIEQKYIDQFRSNINRIASICLDKGITPVFLTSPLLWGSTKDKTLGIRLDNIKISSDVNSFLRWKQMKLYNDALIDVCISRNIKIVDLASLYPKDSKYFIDGEHFSVAGCKKLASLLYKKVRKIIN